MPTTHVLLGALLLALLLFIILLHRRYHLLQYLFFCRFPILLALAFFVFPFVAVWTPAASLLANLFVLTPPQLFVVTWLAIVAAWVVTSAAELVVSGIESYFDLSFYREHTPRPPSGTWRKRFLVLRPIFYALIASPIVLVLLIRSEGALWARGLAVLAGIGLAVLIRLLALVLRDRISGLLFSLLAGDPEWAASPQARRLAMKRHFLVTDVVPTRLRFTFEGAGNVSLDAVAAGLKNLHAAELSAGFKWENRYKLATKTEWTIAYEAARWKRKRGLFETLRA